MPSDKLREKRRPSRLLKTGAAIAIIGGSSYIAMLVGIARSIIIMRLIGPLGRGVQREAGLYMGYAANADIAFRHGLSKDLPLAIGAEDDQRAGEIEEAAFVAVTLTTAIVALGMLVYALGLCAGSWELRVAFAISAGILLAQELTQLYWCVLRSWSNFSPLAVGELIRTGAQLLLMVAGAALLGVTGVMLGMLAAGLILLIYLHRVSHILVRVRMDWPRMWRLLLVGLPIAAISFSDYLLRTVDGAIVVGHYGNERFGYYTLAMQMATYLFAIPRSAGFVIWPKVLEAYGASEDPIQRHRKVLLPTIASAAIMPFIGGLAWIALPLLVPTLVPRFAPGVPAAQVLSFGATLLALPIATNAALVARNRELAVVGIQLLGAGASAIALWYLVGHDAPLIHIAAAACLGYGVAAVFSLAIQLGRSCEDRASAAREVVLALAPLMWALVALRLAHALVIGMDLMPTELGGAALTLFTFIVLASPCLIYGHLRTGFGTHVAALVRGRFSLD